MQDTQEKFKKRKKESEITKDTSTETPTKLAKLDPTECTLKEPEEEEEEEEHLSDEDIGTHIQYANYFIKQTQNIITERDYLFYNRITNLVG